MIKEHILKLIELKPNIGYFTLCKIFGLSMKELFKLLDITNYEIHQKYIEIYNDNHIYYENLYGIWTKREYDDNDNLIYEEDSEGDWYKREFDTDGNTIKEEHSTGHYFETDDYYDKKLKKNSP